MSKRISNAKGRPSKNRCVGQRRRNLAMAAATPQFPLPPGPRLERYEPAPKPGMFSRVKSFLRRVQSR